MINPFYNDKEERLRAGFRIILFVIVFAFCMFPMAVIPYEWLAFLAAALLTCGVYYVSVRYMDLRPWRGESGLIPDKTWVRECTAGIVIAAVTMGLIFLTELWTGGLEVTSFAWERRGGSFWLLPLLAFMAQMTAVGFYEEVMARGYLLRNMAEGFSIGSLTPKQGLLIAVLLSSGIFGIMHAMNPNATAFAVINIVLAGVMLAVPFILTGRLALSIGLHFSWNFFQGGIFGFRVSGMDVKNPLIHIHQSGPDYWTGGAFGPEGGIIGILGILFILLLTVLWLKKNGLELRLEQTFTKSYTEKRELALQKDELA